MKSVRQAIANSCFVIGCGGAIVALAMLTANADFTRSRTPGAWVLFGLPPFALASWLVWDVQCEVTEKKYRRLQRAFAQAIRDGKGWIDPLQLALDARVTGREAKRYLDKQAKAFQANLKVARDGTAIYHFTSSPACRHVSSRL